MMLGILAQGVIGCLTVLTGLNPYLVGLHLLLSIQPVLPWPRKRRQRTLKPANLSRENQAPHYSAIR